MNIQTHADAWLLAKRLRKLAEDVRRPALARAGKQFVVVGLEDGILYGTTDGVIYEVWLTMASVGINWVRTAPKPQQDEAVKQFLELAETELVFRAW